MCVLLFKFTLLESAGSSLSQTKIISDKIFTNGTHCLIPVSFFNAFAFPLERLDMLAISDYSISIDMLT